MDEPEPELVGAPRGQLRGRDVRAIDDDRAGVGRADAGEALEQGRLAGAVAAEQCVDGALADAQRRVRQGSRGAEPLGDGQRLQDGRRLRCDRSHPRDQSFR
nr:hypothetical protein [Frankia sp. Cppng1_Ct_nod]